MNEQNKLAELGIDLPKLSPQAINELNELAISFLQSAAQQVAAREDAKEKASKVITLDNNTGRLLPTVNVPIPQDGHHYFPCPIVHPKRRHVKKCQGCAHFAGVFQRAFSKNPLDPVFLRLSWSEKYGVRCTHVRELVGAQLEIEE